MGTKVVFEFYKFVSSKANFRYFYSCSISFDFSLFCFVFVFCCLFCFFRGPLKHGEAVFVSEMVGSKLDEPDMPDTAGEARTSSKVMYSSGPPPMANQKQDD